MPATKVDTLREALGDLIISHRAPAARDPNVYGRMGTIVMTIDDVRSTIAQRMEDLIAGLDLLSGEAQDIK